VNFITFLDWLTLRDYDKAKASGVRRVVARYIRGNVRAQSGNYMTDAEATQVAQRGDRAMERLDRAANAR
jgi:hypothetical protein